MLLTGLLEILIHSGIFWFAFENKTPQKIIEVFVYIHTKAQILQLHNINLDASWSTECRLTHREIFISISFLLDVANFRRRNLVSLLRIDINEGKFKTTPFWTEISEYNHK